MNLAEAFDIDDEGSFLDADGNEVRCIDDVIILCETKPDGDDGAPCTIPAGTKATVLLFGSGSGWAQLEHYAYEAAGAHITYAKTNQLRLHTPYEEKQRT